MSTSRRTFFGMFAAAPIAAKVAADEVIAKSAGISLSQFGNASLTGYAGGTAGQACLPGPHVSYEDQVTKAFDYIKVFGVPHAVERKMRMQAQHVRELDPDIACKKSWSMSVKIMTQRERNYQTQLERIKESSQTSKQFSLLRDALGFHWPW